ncbi:hypothetical protein C9439_00030 [archaeon SCG-AAA382B04]|nr:hypothetical protein C9439_00030 [archaeon SCG-AAA382B04]
MAEKRESMKGKGADIFLGDKAEGKEGKEESEDKEEEDNSDVEENKNSIKLDGEVEKEKAGFYLQENITEELEYVWFKTRSITGKKVSKSDIVNLALKKLIEEFHEDPEDNFLANQWKS